MSDTNRTINEITIVEEVGGILFTAPLTLLLILEENHPFTKYISLALRDFIYQTVRFGSKLLTLQASILNR
jgi:hypothetical protein